MKKATTRSFGSVDRRSKLSRIRFKSMTKLCFNRHFLHCSAVNASSEGAAFVGEKNRRSKTTRKQRKVDDRIDIFHVRIEYCGLLYSMIDVEIFKPEKYSKKEENSDRFSDLVLIVETKKINKNQVNHPRVGLRQFPRFFVELQSVTFWQKNSFHNSLLRSSKRYFNAEEWSQLLLTETRIL